LAQFKKGYGLGFRYITPIGPIRLDLAQGEDDFFIHFGLGQIF
jgi:outer membrane translocation and assembly module TamA